MKQCDVILAVDDKQIDEVNSLADLLSRHSPGDRVSLKVYRWDEEEKELEVELGSS